jgi:hypothetical protein
MFDYLSSSGRVVEGQRFSVGAAKTLHFLNPELFLIIDSRVAERLHGYSTLLPKSASSYTGCDYVLALKIVAAHINQYGFRRLRSVYCTHLRVTIADTRDCHGDLL